MGKKYCKVNCPETESISKKIIRLPFFSKLGPEIDEVINTIIKFNCSS